MYVPNVNYCNFEDFFINVYNDLLTLQNKNGVNITPSKLIDEMGKRIDNIQSIYYWCHKNKIPVYCPGITDGAIGDALFFQSYKHEDFMMDLSEDVVSIYDMAAKASGTGAIILGAGMVKHHIMEVNSIRKGLDYCVLINNGLVYDGSDSGAEFETEVSQERVQVTCKYVKLFAEVTLVFPLIVQ